MNRCHGEDHGAPEGMGNDLNQQVLFPEIQKTPEGTRHQGSQDEHQIPGEDVDSCIKDGGDQISGEFSPPRHEMVLQKSSPEDLLPGSGNEEKKEKDKNLIDPGSQIINRPDLGLRPGKDLKGKFVSQEENQVEGGCRKESVQEGTRPKRDLRPLPEKGIERNRNDRKADLYPEISHGPAEGDRPADRC